MASYTNNMVFLFLGFDTPALKTITIGVGRLQSWKYLNFTVNDGIFV